MLFSTPIFVFAFLPLVLALYFVSPRVVRNGLLLLASLVFYAWGEPAAVLVMVFSIVLNYGLGRWVDRARQRGAGKAVVATAVCANLAILLVFKYADWLWGGASALLQAAGALSAPLAALGSHVPAGSWLRSAFLNADDSIRLPIGVSFFTFQATSYVIDIYRRDVESERSLIDFAMYKSFFPQLIAGPIVRYRDVHVQIHARRETLEGFAYGAKRFWVGLAKKVLIANVCASTADKLFGLPPGELTPALAWLGTVCYTLQIYFDFSGYSDMAIGMGHLFGFKFLENFRFPYAARSITDFWRRWHISLSSWFRDYLYVPLGGNRGGRARTYFNLVLVFFLCGLWHGASLTFVVWGLFHGAFLVLERVGLGAWLERRGAWLQHVYVLLVVMVGWVFFRATSFGQAGHVLAAMAGIQDGSQTIDLGTVVVEAARLHPVGLYADARTWIAIACGVVGAAPWVPAAGRWLEGLWSAGRTRLAALVESAALVALLLLFALCAMELAAGSYNPFIYFRF
jgi:alginate O-acetyltransferase complex protein AlgI